MTLYKGTIYKTSTGLIKRNWSNVYHIQEVNALEAMGILASVAIAEQSIYTTETTIIRLHVVDPNATNDQRTSTVSYVGARDVTGQGGPLPFWNTARVVFGDNQKRPESKYLRNVIYEANTFYGIIADELVTYIHDNYVVPILALPAVVGPSGEPITTGTVQTAVQMRQVSWGRRTRPGFHRGYVPNA